MHPIAALTLLFGPLAKYTATRGAPLPDGSPLQRGLTPATQDPRDADKVAEAGRYSSALHRLGQQPGGSTMAAVLEEWFTRAGIEHHGRRLLAAVEALERRGVRPTGARPRKPGRPPAQGQLRRYEALLSTAITAYGACLDGA